MKQIGVVVMTKTIRYACLAVLVLLLFSATAYPQNAEAVKPSSEWQRYMVKGEEFSVLLPALPAMDTTDRALDLYNERRERTIGAYADGVAYAIWTFDNSRLKQTIEDIMKAFPRSANTFQKEIDLGTIKGKQYGSQTPQLTAVTRFYITEKNIYVFEVLASSLGAGETSIPRFLNSITFGKDLSGQELKDGVGFQSVATPSSSEIFSGKLVDQKVRVVIKPEPSYTQTARLNQIAGTVVIRCVFAATGSVTNIHVVSGLPDGLDQRAIEAARGIRFMPAVKDGHFVSMWMELQYNFNLY